MVQGTGKCCVALLPAVIATAGIAASLLSTIWCEAIKFVPDTTSVSLDNNIPEATRDMLANEDGSFGTLRFGLFYYSQIQNITVQSAGDTILKVTSQCVDYQSGLEIDAAWKAARAFAIIAPIAAGILAFYLYWAPCCIFFTRSTWSTMAVVFLFVLPGLQSLTLLFLASNACKDNPVVQNYLEAASNKVLNAILTSAPTITTTTTNSTASSNTTIAPDSDINSNAQFSQVDAALETMYGSQDCQWDWGMYANLVSMILFFVTGIVMLIMGAPTRPPPKDPELHTVTYQQTTNEQGEPAVQEVNTDVTIVKGTSVPPWASVNQPAAIPTNTPTSNDNDGDGQWEQAKPY